MFWVRIIFNTYVGRLTRCYTVAVTLNVGTQIILNY